MDEKKHITISIEGVIGAGKSTYIEMLRPHFPNIYFVPEPLMKFQCYKTYNPLDLLPKHAFAVQCYFMKALKDYYRELEDNIKQAEIVVTERSLHSPAVFTDVLFNQGYLSNFEKDLLNEIFADDLNTYGISPLDGIIFFLTPLLLFVKKG